MNTYYKTILVVVGLFILLVILNLFKSDITSQAISDEGFTVTSSSTENVRSCTSWQDNYNPYLQGYAAYVAYTRIDERLVKGDDFCFSRTTLREMSCDTNEILRTTIGECKYGCVSDINNRGYCNKAGTRAGSIRKSYGY